MEYCDGGDFRKLIDARKKKNQNFNEEEIAKFLANITLGLNELHKNGIQHRDLKPLNILIHRVKGKEFLKITDFGLAKNKYAPNSYDTTSYPTGTLDYISPER